MNVNFARAASCPPAKLTTTHCGWKEKAGERKNGLSCGRKSKATFHYIRGVDVYKRNVTTHFNYSLLYIGDKIWPLHEQLSIFFLIKWPRLGLN